MISTIGIRAHDFGKMESDKLAKKVAENNLASVQLAIAKALSNVDDIGQEMSDEAMIKIGKDFEEQKVKISVLGCYLNYAHPEDAARQKNIDIFKRHIDYMPLLKGRVVGTETGSLNGDYSWHGDNHTDKAYMAFAKSLEVFLDYAEQKKVNVAVEGVFNHIIYSNEQMHRLIKDMQSDYLKVILDPVNLLNINNYKYHHDIVKQSFDLFGDRIEVLHAKDYEVNEKGIVEIPHGTGRYDFDFITKVIKEADQDIDILLENANVNNLVKSIGLFG